MSVQEIAKIDSTMLGYEDHGILTCWLFVKYDRSSTQGIGGYTFDAPTHDENGKFVRRVGAAYGMEFIARIMQACGVSSWEKLPGRTIYVIKQSDKWGAPIVGIAPLPTEPGEPFMFSEVDALIPVVTP